MKCKLLTICFLSILFMGLSKQEVYADDIVYTYAQYGDEEKDDDYDELISRSVASIKDNPDYDVVPDDYDCDINHYSDYGDIIMTAIYPISIKLNMGKDLDLDKGYVLTSNYKYSIDLYDAKWDVLTNKSNVTVKDGICSVIKYPDSEKGSLVRATTMKKVDWHWRKVVVYFSIIPSKNTASMELLNTVTIGKPEKLKINNNSAKKKTVTWETSNSKVAVVSKDGIVTAKTKGKCTITATLSDGYVLKCKIFVPSKTESSIMKKAKGTYKGTDNFTYQYYKITFNTDTIGGHPYEVIKLDRDSISGLDIFYVKIYHQYEDYVLEEKTFAINYYEKEKKEVSFIWWYNSSEPSWDTVVLSKAE